MRPTPKLPSTLNPNFLAVGLLALLAAGLLALGTAGCSNPSSAPEPRPVPEPSAESTMPNGMNQPAEVRHVRVNGVELDEFAIQELDLRAGTRVPSGEYWYDACCGACGAVGGPTAAFLPAGLTVGGALRADASGGGRGSTTGVFVNGRELHQADVMALARLGPIVPGRFWLDGAGNWGMDGSDWPLGNLRQAASASATGPGYNRSTLGGHMLSDGQTAGWFDPKSGASVLVGG